MDVPSERPTLLCLITRHEPGYARQFEVINLLALPYYESRGWTFVALDPEREAEWTAWRAAYPGAV